MFTLLPLYFQLYNKVWSKLIFVCLLLIFIPRWSYYPGSKTQPPSRFNGRKIAIWWATFVNWRCAFKKSDLKKTAFLLIWTCKSNNLCYIYKVLTKTLRKMKKIDVNSVNIWWMSCFTVTENQIPRERDNMSNDNSTLH